jgi:starch-binding outer membrane protein, SusD/RagB family
MKKIQSIIAIVAFLMASSCQKELDLKPHQSLLSTEALSTDENIKIVLVGAYAALRSDYDHGGIILRNSELTGADGEISWQGTYNAPREMYNHQIISANGDVTSQWMDGYNTINICNNILSVIDTVIPDDRARVEGEALFIRSLVYFDMVRFFALPYEAGGANTQYGVPLVLTPTLIISDALKVGRNTVQEVYTKVITDLERAATLLPDANGEYATVGAANALLARVYLQKGDFAKARDAANKVISSDLYSLTSTYAKAFNNTDYSTEDIFGAVFTAKDGLNPMTEFWSTTDYGGRDGDIEIMQKHLDLYQADDARLALFWEGNYGMRSGKWNTKYGVVNLFRLAEMYLVRAECNERLDTAIGDTPLNDFNMIHTRAGLPAAESVTLDDILYERRLELAHEGFKIHDMKRLKLDVEGMPYNDPMLVYPIPEREISANPAIANQQNPGY